MNHLEVCSTVIGNGGRFIRGNLEESAATMEPLGADFARNACPSSNVAPCQPLLSADPKFHRESASHQVKSRQLPTIR